ncbi:MAG: DNA polymerase III subunit delta [Ferrovibrio sp.]
MKLAAREVEGFVKRPRPEIRAVLLFGSDAGLIRERAKAVAQSVCADLSDPFRVATLTGAQLQDDPARLADEAAAMALTGGRRVVMISGAGDRNGKLFAEFFKDAAGDALIVVEAGELTPRSSLRVAFEDAAIGVALGCYADDNRALQGLAEEMVKEAGKKIGPDAMAYLLDNLGADRMITRGEIAKLLLYKGDDPTPISLEDCEAVIGDSSTLFLDDAAFAAFGGDFNQLTDALTRCEGAGESPVAILRVAQKHGQKLHLAAASREAGNVMDPKRLGVHWTRSAGFEKQMRQWSSERLMRALEILTDAELMAKSTGMPAASACGDALLRIARAARVSR